MKTLTRTLTTAARLMLCRSFLAIAPLALIASGGHQSFGVFALALLLAAILVESVIRVRSLRPAGF